MTRKGSTMNNEFMKKHYREASMQEQFYLQKEPTGRTAEKLLEVLAESGLSVAEIRGCLEFLNFRLDFSAHLPIEK